VFQHLQWTRLPSIFAKNRAVNRRKEAAGYIPRFTLQRHLRIDAARSPRAPSFTAIRFSISLPGQLRCGTTTRGFGHPPITGRHKLNDSESNSVKTLAKKIVRSGIVGAKGALSRLARPVFGGVGCIFCFHSIQENSSRSSIPAYRSICHSTDFLKKLVDRLRQRDIAVISLDEVHERLLGKSKGKGQFAAFTFDDGYRNNIDHVLPLFEERRLPFCLNITPGLTDGDIPLWWHFLADLVAAKDSLSFSWNSTEQTWQTRTPAEKNCAYEEIANLIRFEDQASCHDLASRLFEDHKIDWHLEQKNVLASWESIANLAKNPLVTIGAHSLTHRTLKMLNDQEIRNELSGSREQVAAEVGSPVDHFAYPFGGRNAVDHHVFQIAKSCNFKTLATTRSSNLFPAHGRHLEALPRLMLSGNNEQMAAVELAMSGYDQAVKFRMRRVITD
jgi:peptidoglycan/xylan/chitin deacetylase (PgdA/CDA1 family)